MDAGSNALVNLSRRALVVGLAACAIGRAQSAFASKRRAKSWGGKRERQLARTIARRYWIAEHAAAHVVELTHRYYAEDPLLLLALAARESSFRPWVVGRHHDVGLCQVRAQIHGRTEAELIDPEMNVATAARVLRECIRRGGSVRAGLEAYNGGGKGYAARVLRERRRLAARL